MRYKSDSGEKDYTDLIQGRINNSDIEAIPDDITSHPCSDDDMAFEDALNGMARFTVDGNDVYEDSPDDTTSYPNFADGDELLDQPETLAESERKDQIESSRIKYTRGDRFFSEDMIRKEAEDRGSMIGDNFDKYCEQNNYKLIEKYTPNDNVAPVVNTSTPEQRASIAKSAMHLI